MSVKEDAAKNKKDHSSDYKHYWKDYELEKDPFTLSSTDQTYYLSPQWEEYLKMLQQFSCEKNVMSVVTGVSGTGKTTLMEQFLSRNDGSVRVHQMNGDSKLTSERLLRLLSQVFDLPQTTGDAIEEQLDELLTNIQYSNQECLLLIDDADELPEDTVDSMLYLVEQQSESQMPFHVILFGRPQLKKFFAAFKGTDIEKILCHIVLEPFSLKETRFYIQECLMEAGWRGDLPFPDADVTNIYRASDGVPARIKETARRMMQERLDDGEISRRTSFIQAHLTKIIGGTLTATAIVFSAFMLNSSVSVSTINTRALEIASAFSQKIRSLQDQVVPDPNSSIDLVSNEKDESGETISESEQEQLAPQDTAQASDFVSKGVLKTVLTSENKKDKPVLYISHGVSKLIMESDEQDLAKAQEKEEVAAAEQQQIAAELDTQQLVEQQSEDKLVNENVEPAPQLATEDELFLGPDDRYLLSLKPEDFTIQLIGLSERTALEKFIDTNNLRDGAKYYQTTLNGNPWYVLLYGDYQTRTDAEGAKIPFVNISSP